MRLSTSSSYHQLKFDVFLSFRGDIRYTFVSHLYDALRRQGIQTFKDDSEHDKGEKLSVILKTIEASSVSVIIFSKNYASSTFCLDEVVKIIECMESRRQKVLPVFYQVDPDDVSGQTGTFREAFVNYQNLFRNNINKVRRWRIALSKAAELGGWDSNKIRPDSLLVEEIVKEVLKKLRPQYKENLEDLVELRSQDKIVKSLSRSGHEGAVQFLGIWGMSGVGKTSIARVVFNKISSQFQGSCFLENVKEAMKYCREKIRQEMLVKIFGEGNTRNGVAYSWRLNNLRHIKVLIVLDDVTDSDQLEVLAGNRDWFRPGSLIIVTSKDKHVLQGTVDRIFEVQWLSEDEALQLFSHFAFRKEPPRREFVELTYRVVSYAKGNPLVLKVLGSFLHKRRVEEWKSALNKYERSRTPNMKIQNVLRVSYDDGLDREEKQVFLYIACCFRGELMSRITNVLDNCGFSTLIDLRVLADRALITMSDHNMGRVEMHDLLQHFGQEIVRQESIDNPGKRSRLWNHEEIRDVFIENTELKQLKA